MKKLCLILFVLHDIDVCVNNVCRGCQILALNSPLLGLSVSYGKEMWMWTRVKEVAISGSGRFLRDVRYDHPLSLTITFPQNHE